MCTFIDAIGSLQTHRVSAVMLESPWLPAPTCWITTFINQNPSFPDSSVLVCHLGPKRFTLPQVHNSARKTTQSVTGFHVPPSEAHTCHGTERNRLRGRVSHQSLPSLACSWTQTSCPSPSVASSCTRDTSWREFTYWVNVYGC